MPSEFEALATYNGEIGRGIVHTAEWDERMRLLQERYNRWVATADGATPWPGAS